MKRTALTITCLIALFVFRAAVYAQESVYPLPADLYLLTSDQHLIRIDAATGEQRAISPQDQPVVDFDIAPDGMWYVYRTSSSNAVIVASLTSNSGYVLAFDASAPPVTGRGQTIAWSPNVAAIAYLVPEGVQIAELGAGESGGAAFSVIRGGPWIDLYWSDPHTLNVVDEAGGVIQISGRSGQWTVALIDPPPLRPAQAIYASLGPQGVRLAQGEIVPSTEGATAFEWGPIPPPVVSGLVMPYTLYFIAPDSQGIAQIWRLPGTGDPPQQLTSEVAPIIEFASAPDQVQTAYAAADKLVVTGSSGRRELAMLSTGGASRAGITWSPDGTQIAYYDTRGVWIVPADGSQPPRLLLQNSSDQNNSRVYFNPRWNPDGTRLMVGIVYYEASILGVADVSTGTVIELGAMLASQGCWTDDGRILTWAAVQGYEAPGLYLLDPSTPDNPPTTILDASYPVLDVIQSESGAWYVLVGSSGQIGPQFLHVLWSEELMGPVEPVYGETAGGYMEATRMAAPKTAQSGPILIAGLYRSTDGLTGSPVVLDLSSGAVAQIQTGGPASDLQWGP